MKSEIQRGTKIWNTRAWRIRTRPEDKLLPTSVAVVIVAEQFIVEAKYSPVKGGCYYLGLVGF